MVCRKSMTTQPVMLENRTDTERDFCDANRARQLTKVVDLAEDRVVAVDGDAPLSLAKRMKSGEQTGKAERMVEMLVRHQDVAQMAKPNTGLHDLPLRSLATVDECCHVAVADKRG